MAEAPLLPPRPARGARGASRAAVLGVGLLVLVACSGGDAASPNAPVAPAVDTSEPPRHYDDTPAASADGTVETRRASALGPTGMTPNGAVQPRGRPTTYWFEYGTTKDYGQSTKPAPLGPKLAAHYREEWSQGAGNWAAGLSAVDLSFQPSGGVTPGNVRFTEPSDVDQNHFDGIGPNQLVQYLWCGSYRPTYWDPAFWGGGDPDLRDAKVSVWMKGTKWSTEKSDLVFWMQTDVDVKNQHDDNLARRTNWAYTGFTLTEYLFSGQWEHVEYRIRNDSNMWSYSGNAIEDQRASYVYQGLDATLGHVNNDIFHMLVYVNASGLRQPTGAIDIDDFEITYRNHSVVFPSNGAKLVSSPPGADDPARLTDGWRFGEGRQWRSAASPTAPQEIVYELAKPVTVDVVQVHQNPDWPSKQIEVWVSPTTSGDDWTILSGSAELPAVLPATGRGGPNFAFFHDDPYERANAKSDGTADVPWPRVAARRIRVRILSGYRSEYWGLGEIELFGEGATMETDDDWYTVNTDVLGLVPGSEVHYRLVTESAGVRTYGGDKTYVVPRDARPIIFTRGASRIVGGAARVEGRVSPLGLRTNYWFEYGETTAYEARTDDGYAGAQNGPRTVTEYLAGLIPGKTYHYRVVAQNQAGTTFGEDLTFVAR